MKSFLLLSLTTLILLLPSSLGQLKPAPKMAAEAQETQYIKGVTRIGEELVILLNPNLVINQKDLKAFAQMAA